MRFYEVGESIKPGFKVVVEEGHRPYVRMVSHDDEVGGPTCLSLGGSLCKELQHHADQGKPMALHWGKVISTNAGMMLTAQTKEQAELDDTALVLISRCYLPKIGITKVESADGYDSPEHITHSKGDGVRRDLFLMRPNTGLYISWDKRLIGADRHLKFIISWDAQKRELVQKPVVPSKQLSKEQQASHRESRKQMHAGAQVLQQLLRPSP